MRCFLTKLYGEKPFYINALLAHFAFKAIKNVCILSYFKYAYMSLPGNLYAYFYCTLELERGRTSKCQTLVLFAM